MKQFISVIFIAIAFTLPACHKPIHAREPVQCDNLVTDTTGTNDNGRVYMPDAFSPNGDGLNETSRPYLQNIASLEFTIYDQGSNIVFATTTPGMGWNTTVAANASIKYYYRIQAVTNAGHKIGKCGELYKLGCVPSGVPRSSLHFEDQLTPAGFTGTTAETLPTCP